LELKKKALKIAKSASNPWGAPDRFLGVK
jgi:hypothetical protein